MNFYHHQLKNGIRIVHKKTSSAVAHCGLIIKGGSRNESDKEQGLAHFIEHVIFKGTATISGSINLDEQSYSLGDTIRMAPRRVAAGPKVRI